MQRSIIFLLSHSIVLIALFAQAPAFAEVIENLRYTYYQVEAKSGQPLLPPMLAVSPIRENGRTYPGHTRSNIRWKFYWHAENSGACRITTVTTTLDVEIILPQIHGANVRQQADFDRFLSALREHERGHHNLATEAARIIDADIKNIPQMESCHVLETHANAISYRTLQKLNEKSRQYDKDTEHGKTQGAVIN